MFQSTHPHRVRHKKARASSDLQSFNPRTHTGCDYKIIICLPKVLMFQSTHPHRVRLDRESKLTPSIVVSIHAPTQGATQKWYNLISFIKFQSTHPHRVRPSRLDLLISARQFQSTHPHRVRRLLDLTKYKKIKVSIHAPTQGATRRDIIRCSRLQSFNPRTHTGCDTAPLNTAAFARMFQSTHPHRVRPWSRCARNRC